MPAAWAFRQRLPRLGGALTCVAISGVVQRRVGPGGGGAVRRGCRESVACDPVVFRRIRGGASPAPAAAAACPALRGVLCLCCAPHTLRSHIFRLAWLLTASCCLYAMCALLPRQLLLKAVRAPLGGSPVPSSPASHPYYRTEAAAGVAEQRKAKGTATPLFASAAVAAKAAAVAKAAAAAKAPSRPSGKFLRHEVASADKAAVKVAALAKSVTASETASTQSKASLVRARIAKIPLHTAMSIVEKGAAHALAQADKDAVEAALLRATLSVPGQRKAEKAAAAAAARAAANKPSAAWLAGAKSLADRNPYAAMHVYTPQQQLLRQQQGSNAQKRGSRAAALAHRGRNALSRLSALSHTGYSRDEAAAYKVHAGKHPIDLGGNDKLITTLPRNEEGEIDRPDPAHREYVKKTRSLGTPVKPDEVQAHWAHGYYHPYSIVKQDDRYVPVGRLLTHRDGVTRREMKMPTAEEEDEGGVDTEEEQPEEEPEAEDCQWGKDVYGRCYTECTDGKDQYGKCHDGSPIWTDPMPLSKLCVGHENATWCQQPEGEEPGNEGDAATKARTVQLASVGGAQGEVLGGSAGVQNAANAPTLAGGIPVAGGKVVWLPLSALSDGAQGKGTAAATQLPETAGNSFVTASPAAVTPEVPKWDPKVLPCAIASLVFVCASLCVCVVAVHVRWHDAWAQGRLNLVCTAARAEIFQGGALWAKREASLRVLCPV